MVRISDILKQRGQFQEPEKPNNEDKKEESSATVSISEQSIEEKPAESIQVSKAMAQEVPETEKEMHVLKAMHQKQLNPDESEKIYNHALGVIKDIFTMAEQDAPLDLSQAREIIKEMVDRIVLGDKELISLTANHSAGNFLYAHSVNISIFSINVGLGLGYNKSKLNELGLGVFLSDVGMVKVMDVANKNYSLSEEEYSRIKKHPIHGSEIISRVKNVQEAIIRIIKEEHERINGTGYPEGLKDGEICIYAKIAAIVDVYEALTHLRPYRKAIEPHEAIRELLAIGSSGALEMSVIKVLINKIGLYPPGSWVELNIGEFGKVISSNQDAPLRPKVNIIFGSDKEKLNQIKPIDLSLHTNIFIKRSINPQDLNLKLD